MTNSRKYYSINRLLLPIRTLIKGSAFSLWGSMAIFPFMNMAGPKLASFSGWPVTVDNHVAIRADAVRRANAPRERV